MTKSIQDNVILIINGLCPSGRVLAEMLAQQGSDVVIVDTGQDTELASHIRRDVRANGRRCLVITPDSLGTAKKSFSRQAIQMIVDTFGRLDAFISYSATELAGPDRSGSNQNGRFRKPVVFDEDGLTKAALRHILTHKQT